MITIPSRTSTKKITAFVAVLVAAAIPLRVSGVSVEQAVLAIALLASFVVMGGSEPVRKSFFDAVTSRQGLLSAAVFVAWAVVLPFSRDPMGSFEIGGRTGLFILTITVVASVLREAPEHHGLLKKAVVVSAVVTGVLAVFSLLGGDAIFAVLTMDFDGSVYPKGYLKAYATAVVCLMPVVVMAGRDLRGLWQVVGYGYIPLVIAIAFLTEDRSAMAGIMNIGVVFSLLFALSRKKHIKWMLLSAATIVSMVILWVRDHRYAYQEQYNNITYLPAWLIDPHRQNIWKFVYEKILDHPWVGNGIDQLNKLPGAHQVVQGLGPTAHFVPSHPHNWMLEILGETGLIGFTPVLIVLAYMIWKFAKGYLVQRDQTALTSLLVVVGFLTCSLFSYSIWAVWWQLVFYVLLAILFALQNRQPSSC